METKFGTGVHQLYGMSSVEMRALGKRTLEWDSNDWKWDGDLFIATQLNPAQSRSFFPVGSGIPVTGDSPNSSSSCSDELNLGIEKGKRELEKKRRVIAGKDCSSKDEVGGLSLNLGGNGYRDSEREVGNWEETSGKKTKSAGETLSRAVCQVEDCGADLSNAKDYHRRHKVCEMHSKATKALVGSVMQRFCQQCSRFHVLQEFDEGKRSCRRRLAGHNKRRRKTNPDAAVIGSSSADNQINGNLILSLRRILSNMHSHKSDPKTDQDLLSHLLRSLACQTSEHKGENVSGIFEKPQSFPINGTFNSSELISTFPSNGPQGLPRPSKQHNTIPLLETSKQRSPANDARGGDSQTPSFVKPSITNSPPAYSEVRDSTIGLSKINNFDLNDIYLDTDDDMEGSPVPANLGTSSLGCTSWLRQDHQSSPPQASRNSDSTSTQSPSSSSGEAQSRTDRIVFKLFGKEPNDFPLVLRTQILDWLSHSPTDIESYIRPGCVILTVYLRQTEAAWEELCYDLSSCLNRLLEVSDDAFWRTGWVYVRIQHQVAFFYRGQVVVDTSLSLRTNYSCKIVSLKPIAISASDNVRLEVRGSNLKGPATRLLCAIEGKYLSLEATDESMDNSESYKQDDLQSIRFSCSIPIVNGRGFVEVEDHGFGSHFFPFIVAEEEDVCSDIRILESTLEFPEKCSDVEEARNMETRSEAMDFLHEMGWLLHRSQSKCRLGHLDPNSDLFPLERFRWLMEFSMDRDWCAVVKKLLDILLNGTVSVGDHSSPNLALSELGLLHRAVRKNSRPMVEFLLRYTYMKAAVKLKPEENTRIDEGIGGFLFRPDLVGPAGLTPLHIAAGKDDSEAVLDALTDDPQMVGIEAWKNARDRTGSTPEDYARLRGHYPYIRLVQKKINKKIAGAHVVLNIPCTVTDSNSDEKHHNESTSLEIGKSELGRHVQRNCKLCDRKLANRTASRLLVYKPAMLSMVGIAAVCVCVALLLKSSPEVFYVFRPFRWELLNYGTS